MVICKHSLNSSPIKVTKRFPAYDSHDKTGTSCVEASSFRAQFDFLSIDLNLLRKWNLGLWLVTYFLMKKVRERESVKEGGRGRKRREGKREITSSTEEESQRMKRYEGV